MAERNTRRGIAERGRSVRERAAFFFALDCPVSYLLAERVERDLGEIAWVPSISVRDGRRARDRFFHAKSMAAAMRLPIVEPESFDFDVTPISRTALWAGEQGKGGAFALTALRFAFVGGFDLSDPDLIAEAAAASGLEVEPAVDASEDAEYDATLEDTSRALRGCKIFEAPAMRIGAGWFTGFDALSQTSEFAAARASYLAAQ